LIIPSVLDRFFFPVLSEFVLLGFSLERHPAVLRNSRRHSLSGAGPFLLATDFGPHFSFFFLAFALFAYGFAGVLILGRGASCRILPGVGKCLTNHAALPVSQGSEIRRLRPEARPCSVDIVKIKRLWGYFRSTAWKHSCLCWPGEWISSVNNVRSFYQTPPQTCLSVRHILVLPLMALIYRMIALRLSATIRIGGLLPRFDALAVGNGVMQDVIEPVPRAPQPVQTTVFPPLDILGIGGKHFSVVMCMTFWRNSRIALLIFESWSVMTVATLTVFPSNSPSASLLPLPSMIAPLTYGGR
jgi:hypothetical protein